MTEGEHDRYVVMWLAYRKFPKKGILSMLLGSKVRTLEPKIMRYDSGEIAEHSFKNIKSNGCIRPLLLKVIKE